MPNNQSEESKDFAVRKPDYDVIDFASLYRVNNSRLKAKALLSAF